MLATLGDLIDDVVVRLDTEIKHATDTPAHIRRRRGGSAANTAVVAASLGAPVRFIGQVGSDSVGTALRAELFGAGVDVSAVRSDGDTGTIVVLVDAAGERSMLTDRKTCLNLTDPDRAWLDGVTTLHVPMYSLVEEPLASTAFQVIDWAHELGIPVSIDASSAALILARGPAASRQLLATARPEALFANEDEAAALGIDGAKGAAITIVKRGNGPATVYQLGSEPQHVEAKDIGAVADTTGAGDAFAAGFLVFGMDSSSDGRPLWLEDVAEATKSAHAAAAKLLQSR